MKILETKSGYNPALLNEIQPQGGVKFEENKIVKGDGYEACLYVYAFPIEVDNFWLNSIVNIENTITTIDIATESKENVIKKIDKALDEQNSRYNEAVKHSDKRKAEREYLILEALAKEVMDAGEVIKLVSIRIFVASPTKDLLEDTILKVKKSIESGKNFKAIVLLNEQHYEYQSLFTSYSVQKEYDNRRTWKPIPALSLGAGLPFHHTSINDPLGLYIGTTTTGGSVILDIFHKTDKRLSYSCLLMGKPGSGKSSLLKKLIVNNIISGNFVRVIDVANEFSELVNFLGGKEIFLDGTGDIINPLHIYPLIADEKTGEILDDKCFSSNLAKLNNLYRTLKPTCSEDEISQFEILVGEFYEEFGIEKNKATRYKSNEYPILENLLNYVKSEIYLDDGKTFKDLTPTKLARLESIELLLKKLILNYGDLFNAHSTIEDITKIQLVSYNCTNLKQLDKKIFTAQLFTALSSIWGQGLVHGRKEKYDYESGYKSIEEVNKFLLILDEANNFANINNMDSVEIIESAIRELRKFFGGVILSNHNISDYVPESAKNNEALERIKKLFSMTQYKFIFNQDNTYKELLGKVFKGVLSESEINVIPNLAIGQCIFSLDGKSNIAMKVELSDFEKDLFKGGR
ncbi:VirB4 family type IV secretion system protein [uncultured Clostridium sp.]|uniref:VirB4 family type IV secretion system protein n=1 Tax=uncultured Clostridium sp. TaxID=59620 RepID=UPI0025FED40F|nr:hypothetical protein [uncultured Clostridium sp.]